MAWMILDALGKAALREEMPDLDVLQASTDRLIRALPRARVATELNAVRQGTIGNDELRPILKGMAQDFFRAIRRGQVVDLGDVPIVNLVAAHAIGKDLLNSQAVRHPFTTSWIVCLTMLGQEGGKTPVTALIAPNGPTADSFHFAGLSLSKGDVFRLAPQKIGHYDPTTGRADALLSSVDEDAAKLHQKVIDILAAAVLASLAVLNTRGVSWSSRKTIPNRRGGIEKVGMHRLASPYFTALGDRRRASEKVSGEGEPRTHASPRPHVRRGHLRHLASGETIWVRDCLVNVASEGEEALFERTAYKVKPPLPGTKPAGMAAFDGRTPSSPAHGDDQ